MVDVVCVVISFNSLVYVIYICGLDVVECGLYKYQQVVFFFAFPIDFYRVYDNI